MTPHTEEQRQGGLHIAHAGIEVVSGRVDPSLWELAELVRNVAENVLATKED